jgi:hypothetical protein
MSALQDRESIDHALLTLGMERCVIFLQDLHAVIGGQGAYPNYAANDNPAILDQGLFTWASLLSEHTNTVTRLEGHFQGSIPRCLLLGGDETSRIHLRTIIELLPYYKSHLQPPMLAILKLLAPDGNNASEIAKVLTLLTAKLITEEGIETLMRILEMSLRPENSQVAKIMLACWLADPNFTKADKSTLIALAELLKMAVDQNEMNEPQEDALVAAADYLEAQYVALFAEAQRLESLRSVYQKTDPIGVSEILESLGIETTSSIDDYLAEIPPALFGLVERVGNREVELLFPLSHLRPLQRIAMGLGNAQQVIVRLHWEDYNGFLYTLR